MKKNALKVKFFLDRAIKIAFRNVLIIFFLCSGKSPWSYGYIEYRNRYIDKNIDNDHVLTVFREGQDLPNGFGIGLDERVVEYLWVYSKMPKLFGRYLDAGSALNYEFLIKRIRRLNVNLTILTLAPERRCFWKDGVSYLFHDLRDIPYRNMNFDVVVCISTLEHVGLDNTMYGGQALTEIEEDGFILAARELWRVLKERGSLLITVPFGKRSIEQWNLTPFMQQFDSDLLNKLVGLFPDAQIIKEFFRYTSNGWVRSSEEECRNLEYFNIHKNRARPHDKAAAARAVACIQVNKQ